MIIPKYEITVDDADNVKVEQNKDHDTHVDLCVGGEWTTLDHGEACDLLSCLHILCGFGELE